MRFAIFASTIVGIFLWGGFAFGAMTSTNWEIRWDTIGNGGSDDPASASYQLRDTLGNTGIGQGTSASYDLRAGYRQGVFDQIITFSVNNSQLSTKRAATSSAGTTITTSTTGLAVGDFIALVQDLSASQVTAIGRIASIGVVTITVDLFKDGGVAPIIDGTNDFVYKLNGTSLNLDELDPSQVNTGIVSFEVSTEVDNGYVVQVMEDGDLRDGSDTIDDVADGAVTTGSEEYGGRSSDTTLAGSTFDTIDTAFTNTFQDVADEASPSFESRNFLTLKASIDGSTVDGTYGHTLTLIVSGNF